MSVMQAESLQLGELQEPSQAKEQDHRSLVAFAGAIRSALRHSHVEEQVYFATNFKHQGRSWVDSAICFR